MEKEKPFLFTDLVPPGEVYIPDDSDAVPIRTWSRGDPFEHARDGGFKVRPGEMSPAGNSLSTDGMLHYTSIQPVYDGSQPLEEGEGEEEVEGEQEYGDDADYYEDEEEIVPNYSGVNYAEVEQEYDQYQSGDQFYETDEQNEDDEEGDEEGDEEDEEDGEEDGEEEYEDEFGGGEEDDQVNYAEGDEDGDAGPGGINSFSIASEHFEKVTLSPRELDLLRASGPSEEYNDLVEIMNEYNQLVDYITSPRSPVKKPANKAAAQAKVSIAKSGTQGKAQVTAQQAAQHRKPARQSDSGSEGDASSEADEDGHSTSQQSLLARNKLNIMAAMVAGAHPSQGDAPQGARKKATKPKPKQGEKKPKKKLFGQALEDHKRQLMQAKVVGRTEVDEKHKAMLSAMVEARRREEEELQREAERAMAKRKKFKEALLEKAMRARQNQVTEEDSSPAPALRPAPAALKKEHSAKLPAGAAPSFLAPTKAYQVQCAPARTAQQVVFTDEDLLRQEQEKREQVAAIRRKFKEQHKKILNALKAKNEEDERRLMDEVAKEAARKEKHRQKLQRLLSEKQSKTDSSPAAGMVSQDDQLGSLSQRSPGEIPVKKPHPRSAQPLTTPSADADAQLPEGAAGGGLAAIRRRTRSLSQNAAESAGAGEESLLAQQRLLQKQQKDVEAAVEQDLKDAMAKELRKVASKEQANKLTSYLNNIADQRKRDEMEKKKKEERGKKRMQILSARLLNEAAERKLMQQNDTWRYAGTEATAPSSSAPPVRSTKAAADPPVVVHKPRPPAAPAPSTSAATTSAAASAGQGASSESTKPPRKVKITAEMTEKLVTRLQNQSSKIADGGADDKENYSNVPARDFNDWKRKNGVPADGLVFAMTGWYPCVKEALLARGWHFNPDPTSPYFNLKWTLRSLEVSQETLQPWQLTNHYLKNVAITTKAGLIKSLQSLVWTADVEANDIIPRGYDLSNNLEMQAFLDDFRSQKAESVLKALYLQLTGLELPAMNRDLGPLPSPRATMQSGDSDSADGEAEEGEATEKQSKQKSGVKASSSVDAADSVMDADEPNFPPVPALAPGVALENISVNSAVFDAILAVLEKQIKPYEDSYIDDRDAHTEKMITDLEWELISKYKIDQSFPGLPADVPEPVDAFLKEKEDMDVKPTAAQLREKRRQAKQEEEAREEASQRAKVMRPLTTADLERIHNTLCALMHHNKYQTGLNGKGDKSLNMWIVKPAAKSRGRGITTFMDLNKLLKYVDAGTGRYSQWVVQKYMENPLIVANRKFDLRQWVVVTNWNPLTVWFYDECYARFSVEEYSTDANDLSNAYIHLVNNSIGKNSENFNKLITAENGVPVEGYMWSFDQIADFMQFKSGQEMMRSKVHPRMKDIAKWSLMCASEMIEHRKNSWELYGFDFMVDDEYNAWLIEINSSPACDYSTTVTERYVQKALVELLSVVLDTREWDNQPKKTRGDAPDTGGWERIYQGPLLDMPVGAFGTEMSLKGEAYKNVPARSNAANVNVQNMNADFGSVKANNGPAAMSSKLRASVSLQSAQHQASGESGPDTPKRPARTTVAPQPSAAQAKPFPGSVRAAAEATSTASVAEESSPTNKEDDEFNDSDEEVLEDSTGKPTKRSAQRGKEVAVESAMSGLSVGGTAVTQSKPVKPEPAKVARQNAAPPTVASIPIKVFSVDF